MKKIADNRFLCLDFVNSDLSKIKTINGLIETFIHILKNEGYEFNQQSIAPQWEGKIHKRFEQLKKLQEQMIQFINYSLACTHGNDLIDEDFHRINDFMADESSQFKFVDDSPDKLKKSYFDSIVRSQIDVVKKFVVPGLCYDLMALDKEKYWDRIINCLECNKFFIPKTRRYQLYCSKKCRDKHRNRERVKSGKWAKYMKQWRNKQNKIM